MPVWLAPVQVKVLPVSDKSAEYAEKVYDTLCNAKIRAELDRRNEKIGYKIREAQTVDRVPYMLIIGQKEMEEEMIPDGMAAARDHIKKPPHCFRLS